MRVSSPVKIQPVSRAFTALQPPVWVAELSQLPNPLADRDAVDFCIGTASNGEFIRVTVIANTAVEQDGPQLQALTLQMYRAIFESLSETPAIHPVRFWNFLPEIHQQLDGRQSRYMFFNAGRYQAFLEQFGDHSQFDSRVPTASAVGHRALELSIHCLATREAGIHMGNPRQISPHHYSRRFGDLPPCFARATLLPAKRQLLIGGTASIRGEDTVHPDLPRQLHETLLNLSATIETASADACIQNLRIYYPRPADASWLREQLRQRFPQQVGMEFIVADLCRLELLVEIEATAAVPAVGVSR